MRFTRAGVATALSSTAVLVGGLGGRVGGIVVASSSCNADEVLAEIDAPSSGDANSRVEDFGRSRCRTTYPATVIGLELRTRGDFADGIFVALLDKASAKRLF